jgi:hypothetical protein
MEHDPLEHRAKREFSFPHEVADDPSLSLAEKRAILSEWASDACAVPSFPTLRILPGTNFPVTFSSIMDARLHLDRKAGGHADEGRSMGHVIIAGFAKARAQASC